MTKNDDFMSKYLNDNLKEKPTEIGRGKPERIAPQQMSLFCYKP